ncbi:hypothetical protein D3C87_2082710 [compost metagenome]
MNLVTGATQLLGSSKTGWARTDDRNLFASVNGRRLRHDEAEFVCLVGDCLFNGFDRNRCIFKV